MNRKDIFKKLGLGIAATAIIPKTNANDAAQKTQVNYNVQYNVYHCNGMCFRTGIRDNTWVIDKAITPKKFNGCENIDWINLLSIGE